MITYIYYIFRKSSLGKTKVNLAHPLQKVYDKAKSFNGKETHQDIDHIHDRLTFLIDDDYENLKTRRFVNCLFKRRKEWLFRLSRSYEIIERKKTIMSEIPASSGKLDEQLEINLFHK